MQRTQECAFNKYTPGDGAVKGTDDHFPTEIRFKQKLPPYNKKRNTVMISPGIP